MISSELLAERRRLLDEWDGVDSPEGLRQIQEHIADGIRQAELAVEEGHGDRDGLVSHIKLLRLYADGLAWHVLHPHVIRQLAKNPAEPPSLMNQGEAFENVLASARQRVEEDGLPVLIADISNILKIGDLIVVTHPELPQIVECKTRLPHPKYWMRGRFGRQISRALGTLTYLSGKPVKVHGEDHIRVVVESDHRAERNWDVVATCVDGALSNGIKTVQLSENELLGACRPAHQSEVVRQVAEVGKGHSSPLFYGTSAGLLNMFDGLFAPPIVWPLGREARFALMEEEVLLVHLVSAAAFEGDYGGCEIAITDNRGRPVSVFLEGKEYPFSLRFIYDVLYGFETVPSCVSGLLSFARQVAAVREREDDVLGQVPQRTKKPEIIYVDSLEGPSVRDLSEHGEDIVVMPEDVWKLGKSSGTQPGDDGSS